MYLLGGLTSDLGLAPGASTRFGDTFEKGAYRGASNGCDRLRFVQPARHIAQGL